MTANPTPLPPEGVTQADRAAMDAGVIETLLVHLEHQLDWDGKKWKPKTVSTLKAERALAAKVIRHLHRNTRRAKAAVTDDWRSPVKKFWDDVEEWYTQQGLSRDWDGPRSGAIAYAIRHRIAATSAAERGEITGYRWRVPLENGSMSTWVHCATLPGFEDGIEVEVEPLYRIAATSAAIPPPISPIDPTASRASLDAVSQRGFSSEVEPDERLENMCRTIDPEGSKGEGGASRAQLLASGLQRSECDAGAEGCRETNELNGGAVVTQNGDSATGAAEGEVGEVGEDTGRLIARLEKLAASEMNNLSFDVEGISKAASVMRLLEDRVAKAEGEVEELRRDLAGSIEDAKLLREYVALYEARATKAEAANARLREALAWYAEQTRLCRLIHSEGDTGRHALSEDGGKRARQALDQGAEG